IGAAATLLSETLFTALLVAAVFLAVLAAERDSGVLEVCAGVLFGLATLCRSIGAIYLIAAVAVLVAWRFRRAALVLLLGGGHAAGDHERGRFRAGGGGGQRAQESRPISAAARAGHSASVPQHLRSRHGDQPLAARRRARR